MKRRCHLVDVFTENPLLGNPLAVVVDSEGLTTEQMLSITQWLNFSESTFLLPPSTDEADYRVRIFCPERELPFAGHPTLGTCHIWLAEGGEPKGDGQIIQECDAGLVPIQRSGDRLAFQAPQLIREGPVDEGDLNEVVEFLGIGREDVVDAQWADNGPGWIAVLLESADAVLALEPAGSHPSRIDVGVVGPHPAGGDFACELRAFFSDQTGSVREDPVTGSLNASVAQWLLNTGRTNAPYVAQQGTCVGRAGKIYIDVDDAGEVWVGGNSITIVEGTIDV